MSKEERENNRKKFREMLERMVNGLAQGKVKIEWMGKLDEEAMACVGANLVTGFVKKKLDADKCAQVLVSDDEFRMNSEHCLKNLMMHRTKQAFDELGIGV